MSIGAWQPAGMPIGAGKAVGGVPAAASGSGTVELGEYPDVAAPGLHRPQIIGAFAPPAATG
ncbi:MAG: hypothetical protein ACE5JR_06565 [Gemmatimonadota bacterium]